MKVLVDTCVLAEIRHPGGNPAVKAAFAGIDDAALFLSVLTLGEIAKGVALLPAGKKKRELTGWVHGLVTRYADRVLPVDRECASIWGELTARASKSGVVIPAVDGLLAATALRYGLHLLTRNTRHFAATGVLLIDPWNEGKG
jgi:toxin FitB